MSLQEIGLLVSGFGGIALGFSSQLGLAAAYGGKLVWSKNKWRLVNLFGWLFLVLGLFVQWCSVQNLFNC